MEGGQCGIGKAETEERQCARRVGDEQEGVCEVNDKASPMMQSDGGEEAVRKVEGER